VVHMPVRRPGTDVPTTNPQSRYFRRRDIRH
jgi:hypothetical protein